MPEGSGRRTKRAQMQDVLGELVTRAEQRGPDARDPRTELAESFRRARAALETVTRDVVALRSRVGAKTPR
jgi:hypothetical protein